MLVNPDFIKVCKSVTNHKLHFSELDDIQAISVLGLSNVTSWIPFFPSNDLATFWSAHTGFGKENFSTTFLISSRFFFSAIINWKRKWRKFFACISSGFCVFPNFFSLFHEKKKIFCSQRGIMKSDNAGNLDFENFKLCYTSEALYENNRTLIFYWGNEWMFLEHKFVLYSSSFLK